MTKALAYILRTPQAGGHWIALLPPETVAEESGPTTVAVLCDSLETAPFLLSQPETEDLLTACVMDNAASLASDANAAATRWACFLITDEGEDL